MSMAKSKEPQAEAAAEEAAAQEAAAQDAEKASADTPPDTENVVEAQDAEGPQPPAADVPPYPNLAGAAKAEDVMTIQGGQGGFKPSYINWARTMQMLREGAPGWLPELVQDKDGNDVHLAPGVGGCLMIRFKHADGRVTPAVPQAIMDHKNNSVPVEKISARDVSDTFVRGLCKAAALTFGLAYELWAKMELESGYASHGDEAEQKQAQESGKTVVQWKEAFKGAKDLVELQRLFAMAWNQNRSKPADQDELKAAYEGCKIDLEEG
jgi:hypothetical protein